MWSRLTPIFPLLTLLTALATPKPSVYHLTSTPSKLPSTVEFTYSGSNLDGPKVRPVNTTTFDWWYFDAVSSNLANGDLSSVVLVFYDATAGGFEVLSNSKTTLVAQLSGSFVNGTPFLVDGLPGEATVVTVGDGSEGHWGEYGGWEGSSDGRGWEVTFKDEGTGVKGRLTLESVAPAHLPCGVPVAGATEVLMPAIGWANAVPDAKATVELDISGTEVAFSGVGYHDKNWGSIPFFEAVSSWYWGHAHLGPYSIVWFDALSQPSTPKSQPTEYFSAFVAKDGCILTASCAKDSVTARPWGGEDEYPPPHNKKTPNGFEIIFADVEGKEMRVNVTNAEVVLPAADIYDRFIGTVEGNFAGEEEKWTGVAVYEQFKV